MTKLEKAIIKEAINNPEDWCFTVIEYKGKKKILLEKQQWK